MSKAHTNNCVQCGAPAKFWSGHVLRHGKKVIAGWCGNHGIYKDGFVGHYRKWMGRVDDSVEPDAEKQA